MVFVGFISSKFNFAETALAEDLLSLVDTADISVSGNLPKRVSPRASCRLTLKVNLAILSLTQLNLHGVKLNIFCSDLDWRSF